MRGRRGWHRHLRLWGPDPVRDVDEELAFHLSMKREELLAAGVAPDRVEEELTRAFGDRTRIEKELKEIARRREQRTRRARIVDEVRIDLRHAWRSFRRRPAVPAVIVGTLALAIGAGTAVFTLFDAVVLNPLAVERPGELVLLREEQAGSSNMPGFSYPMSRFLREHSTTTAGIAGWTTTDVGLSTAEAAARRSAALVTANYFAVLGLVPQHGRMFIAGDEAAPGTTPYVVLSDALWRSMFGGDPAVIGRRVAVNETPFTVIGVGPRGFRGTSLADPVDLWLPITMVQTVARSGLMANEAILDGWSWGFFPHVARVPEGTSVERALAELTTLHAAGVANAQEAGEAFDVHAVTEVTGTALTEAAAGRSRAELLRFLTVLAVVVGIVLAVACVNVANLLLMRSRERHLEMTIRAAVGASSKRVARQLLLESLVLAVLAGIAGAGIGMLTLRLLTSFSLPGGIALSNMALALDGRVLGFALAVALLCALAFGLAPVIGAARTDVMDALRGGPHGRPAGRVHAGSALIATQVALSLVLLVGGSLFVRSLHEALDVEVGFHSDGVATVAVGLRQHGYSGEQLETFTREVLEAVRAQAGTTHAAAGTRVPIETSAFRMPIHAVEGTAARVMSPRMAADDAPRIPLIGITPGYFETLGLELLSGRGVAWSDRSGAPLVAFVTQHAAERLWPGEDPIGRTFVPMFGEPFTVVGVVRDAHLTSLTEREPHIFLALFQTLNLAGPDRLRFVAAGHDAATSLSALRRVIRSVDPRLPLFDERNVKQHIDAVLMPQRFGSVLLGVLGAIALLICAIGIYAVAAYDVATRRRELGIRAALGASRRELVRAVIQRAAAAICAGVGLGLVLAAVATQGLRGLLFGITPYEPGAWLAAAVLLGLVAVLASWLPARRAARTNPLSIVREW